MNGKSKEFILLALENIDKVQKTQSEVIGQAAKAVAKAVVNNGFIYTFGTGHSHMLAEEIFYRAGGLASVYPILDQGLMLHNGGAKSTNMERLAGYSKVVLDEYPIKPGDVIFIFSNSGRNSAPVEMALEAKSRGMVPICITSLTQVKCSKFKT